MKKRLFSLGLALCIILALCAGCGGSEPQAAFSGASAPEASVAEAPASADDAQTPAEPEDASPEGAETEPEADDAGEVPEGAEIGYDFTEANAKMDFSGFQEMLKTLTSELPVVDEPETVSYFFGFESASLNYIPGGGELCFHH